MGMGYMLLQDPEANLSQLFSGPMAESLPTSVSGFHHRRARADSTTSFSFYQEDVDEDEGFNHEGQGVDDLDELPFEDDMDEEEDSTDLERQAPDNDYVLHRRASNLSRRSVHSHLLRRNSAISTGSGFGGTRYSQKIYMANEDLYLAIAGFQTSPIGQAIYTTICLLTLGVGWLVFRWVPRWHVKLVGKKASLRDCDWVVIEVQLPGV